MPETAAELAAALSEMRRGRGPRRQEMRERLATVDEGLRRGRNIEAVRLADLSARLRAGRGDLAVLKAAVEASTARLAEFDSRIVQAMIASDPRSAAAKQVRSSSPDQAAAAEARATLRARLTMAAATLVELLPKDTARQLETAVARAIRRLGP
jgi:hypothetical protein